MIPQKAETNVQSIDQALNTDKITPKLVQYIVDKIVREIQPEKIILFGSYARRKEKVPGELFHNQL
jgi:hypothetical protein